MKKLRVLILALVFVLLFSFTLTACGDEEEKERDKKRKEIRDLLEEFTKFFNRTYLVDLYTYAPLNNAEYKRKFRLGHMTPTGYVLTARMIESYIDYIIRKNPKDFNQVGFIGSELYFTPEEE